jgi:hypothetical protein
MSSISLSRTIRVSKSGPLCTGQKLAPCEYNRTKTLILVEYASAVYVLL